MSEHNTIPLQGQSPAGTLRLLIDSPDGRDVDVILWTEESQPAQLFLARTSEQADSTENEVEVILYGAEIRMLRDFLNSPVVARWIE